MDEKAYWVGFNHIKGIGAVRLTALISHFGSAEAAWRAPASQLAQAGLGSKLAERVSQLRASLDLPKIIEQIESKGIRVLTLGSEDYPQHLAEVDQPPPVLYVRGTLTYEDQWAVAIVGTRAVTAYGNQITHELATVLAGNGITVVSGLARGVDTVAHTAALKAGGRSLAILGCGVDRIYPPENRQLAEKLMAQGALVSDYAPGTPPDSVNFPPRNRIISGLSLATVVIEAGGTSGALITAGFAVEQGREVFGVPGNILALQSKGTNRLIQNGARPLLDVRDLLDVLNLTRNLERREVRKAIPSDETEAHLLGLLGGEPLHVDEIRAQSGLPIEKVSAALTMMELNGMVRHVSGMQYVAVREDRGDYFTD